MLTTLLVSVDINEKMEIAVKIHHILRDLFLAVILIPSLKLEAILSILQNNR
ncbi:hypothetical protein FD42_GL001034 [Lentilactobacillus hilgardii DSM 20176 = ATCC 8290]|nr:hypothetical protein FD42_GL001034 [Lentilactobacillus hilgardii DSM 20176 = ATCC 8290]